MTSGNEVMASSRNPWFCSARDWTCHDDIAGERIWSNNPPGSPWANSQFLNVFTLDPFQNIMTMIKKIAFQVYEPRDRTQTIHAINASVMTTDWRLTSARNVWDILCWYFAAKVNIARGVCSGEDASPAKIFTRRATAFHCDVRVGDESFNMWFDCFLGRRKASESGSTSCVIKNVAVASNVSVKPVCDETKKPLSDRGNWNACVVLHDETGICCFSATFQLWGHKTLPRCAAHRCYRWCLVESNKSVTWRLLVGGQNMFVPWL